MDNGVASKLNYGARDSFAPDTVKLDTLKYL